MKKRMMGFFRTFFQTLNPASYSEISESRALDTFLFFASSVFAAFIIMMLVMLPAMFSLPNAIEKQFDRIDTFTFDINFSTNAPIKLPENNPVLVISYGNETTQERANVILDNNTLYYGALFNNYAVDFNSYKNAKEKKAEISNILAAVILFMLPALLLIFFFYLLVKYFIIILVSAVLLSIIVAMTGRKLKFSRVMNIAFYASSVSIVIDLIFFALGFSFYYIQFLPSAVLMIVAAFIASEKRFRTMKSGKYIEIK